VLIAFDGLGIYGLHSRLNTPYAVLSTEARSLTTPNGRPIFQGR